MAMWVVALGMTWATMSRSGGVTVVVHETRGVYHIHGAFQAAVPVAVAWGVLVDYEHIGTFVHSIRSSAFLLRPDGERVLAQDAVVGSFPFHRSLHVELALHEVPGRRVEFHDVSARDFDHYDGSWLLERDSLGTRIDYALEAEPIHGLPGMFGRGLAARQARDLLSQVRLEMVTRSAAWNALPKPMAKHAGRAR